MTATQISAQRHSGVATHRKNALGGQNNPGSQSRRDAHEGATAGVNTSQGAIQQSLPNTATSPATKPAASRCSTDTHGASAGGTNLPPQAVDDGQPLAAVQAPPAGGGSPAGPAESEPTPEPWSRAPLVDPELFTLAALLDDIEGVRKAQNNRLRILTTSEPAADGVMRGFGLDEAHPSVAVLAGLLAGIDANEHQVILALQRAMRRHPLNEWQPRTVSQLWAYAGLHVLPTGHIDTDAQCLLAGGGNTSPGSTTRITMPIAETSAPGSHTAARRQKGVQANWSTDAKTRAYLIATSCIKQQGEYRQVYLDRREHTAVTHPDWTDGHSHQDALRVLSKRILRDLWRAARDYHTGEELS